MMRFYNMLVGGGVSAVLLLAAPALAETRTAFLGDPAATPPRAAGSLLWFGPADDRRRAAELVDALEEAPSHGLPAGRYRAAALREALTALGGDEAKRAALDAALTESFLRFAGDLRAGLLEPGAIDRDLHFAPQRPPREALLAAARNAADIGAYFKAMAPADPQYGRLRRLLAELREEAKAPEPAPVAKGPLLRVGDRGPRVAALRARLERLGDLPAAEETADRTFFDADMEAALRRFQRRHGLNDDGVAGPRTLRAANATARYRLGQVLVNLERLRWADRNPAPRRIVVNEADFRVRLIDGGRILFDERVIIGKAKKFRTPEFADRMTYLVFNPSWNVPRSIATKEILPLLEEDPGYLAEENMTVLSGVHDEEVETEGRDWSLYSENDFPFRLRQLPGEGNALGRVKFMFPNQFNIYLHDTPAKRLFDKDARAFSHGCVRVRDPLSLAHALLAPQVEDPESFVAELLEKGEETIVRLQEPVPVLLTYRTAWVDDAGVRQFREDIYGRDARVLAALEEAGVRAGF